MPLIAVPPLLSASLGNSSFTVGGTSTYVNPTITVTDVESSTLASASVSLVTGFLTGDTLAIASSALAGTNIAASYNAATGTLSLTGVDTLAHYDQALQAVTYASTAANPLGLNLDVLRVASFTVNDGTLSSLPSLADVSILPNPISISTTGPVATFVAGATAAIVAPTLAVADTASSTLSSATVALGAGFLTGDVLSVASSALQGTNIAANYNAVTGKLALTGVDTVADYDAILKAVSFSSTSLNPTLSGTDLSRVATVTVNDGTITSTPIPLTITLTPAATPIVTAGGADGAYVTNEGPAIVNSGVTLSEAGGSSVQSATVSISSGLQAGDVLAATTTGTNIAASYNALNGTLTLAGADTAADYQQVLRSVTFASTAADPTAGGTDASRTISIAASAGTTSSSVPVNASIGVALAAAPTITASGAGGDYHIAGGPVVVNADVGVTDPGTLQSASVVIGTGLQAGDVLATDTIGTNITASYIAGTGTLSLTGVDSAADYQQVLRNITYASTAPDPSAGGTDNSRIIAISASAGPQSTSALIDTTVTIDPAPTATPAVTVGGTGGSYHSNQGPVVVNNAVSVSESGGSSLQSAMIVIATGLQAGDVLAANTSGTGITASYDANTGTLTLTGTDTAADYQQVLRSVTYASTANDVGAGGTDISRTISFSASAGASNTSTPVNTTITVEQAPVCPPTAPGQDVVPGTAYTGTAGTSGTGALHGASDPDGGTLSVTQVDGSAANVGASTQGTYGHLTLNADGSEVYQDDIGLAIVSAADGSPIADTFSYVVTDSHGSSTASTGTFTTGLLVGGIETLTNLSDAAASARFLNLGATRLNVTQNAAGTYSGVIRDGTSGNVGGVLSVAGTAALTLTGINTYTGKTSVAGTLLLGAGGSVAASKDVKMIAGGVFDISGNTGGTTITKVKGPAGTVMLGSQTLTLSGSTAGEFDGTIADGGASGGVGGILKIGGTGAIRLTGLNTYTGKTAISGTLQLGSGGSIASSKDVKMVAGGAFDISGDADGATIAKLKGPGGTVMLGSQTLTLSGSTTGEFDGTITDGGASGGIGGILKVGGTGAVLLTGINSYTGKTAISGTLQLGPGSSVASSKDVKLVAGGFFDISGSGGATITKLKGPGGTVELGAQTLTLTGATAGEFDGTITDGGASGGDGGVLKLAGPGAVLLTGTNTYTGGTIVGSGSTLELDAAGAAGAGTVTFDGSGTVKLDAPALTTVSGTQSSFANTIAGLGTNDTLDLSSLAYSSGSSTATINNGVLTATSGGNSIALNITGIANGTQFTSAADATGGTLITQTPVTPGTQAFVYTPTAAPSSSHTASPSGDLAPSPATMLAEVMNTPSSSAASTYTAPVPQNPMTSLAASHA